MKKLVLLFILLIPFNLNAANLSKGSRGSSFNPAIGINALSLFKNTIRNPESDGFSLQEIELQFSSDVDPYFRAEATLALHQEESTGDAHNHSFKIDPEEVFVETIAIKDLTIKAGKFNSSFGKHNSTHSHARPFIYRSQVEQNLLGHEGLSEVGLSFSFLAPFSWFSELQLEVLQPKNEVLFDSSKHSLAYVLRQADLWEINDNLTLEWGKSGLYFFNHEHGDHSEKASHETHDTHENHDSHEDQDSHDEDEAKTLVLGSDLTLKWRSSEKGKHSSFQWTSEVIYKDKKGSNHYKNMGLRTYIKQQLMKRWFIQGQYEQLGIQKSETAKELKAYSGLLAFAPSEFSAIRLQYDYIDDEKAKAEQRISLQLNISIGAHPAHKY